MFGLYAALCLSLSVLSGHNYAEPCSNSRMIGGRKMTTEQWVKLQEVAEHLGVSQDTVRRRVKNEGMPAHKLGRLWKFKISEVDSWLRAGQQEKDETNG